MTRNNVLRIFTELRIEMLWLWGINACEKHQYRLGVEATCVANPSHALRTKKWGPTPYPVLGGQIYLFFVAVNSGGLEISRKGEPSKVAGLTEFFVSFLALRKELFL